MSILNQSVLWIPCFEVAFGPDGKAETTFNHRVHSASNVAHFGRDLDEVLILAEDHGHIQFSMPRHAHHIQTEAKINPLFPSDGALLRSAAVDGNVLHPIPQGA